MMTKDINKGKEMSNSFKNEQLEALRLSNVDQRQKTLIERQQIILDYISVYYHNLKPTEPSDTHFTTTYKMLMKLLFEES